MSTIVQKYGGSSVSTPAKLREVAQRIVNTRTQGHKVVVVVSAMGDTTNQLLSLAKEVSPQPHRRELDMLLTVGERISMSLLSMAIQDLGAPAVSFTGSQSGIITTDTHTNARIIKVKPTRVLKALDDDYVVIIAGFQGVSERLEITSLGRGGSDTTAVAMAAALNADFVEICSDVDGVYSTDPRICPKAQKVSTLNYDEMQSLSDSGAKVLNAEAIEWARRSGIEVRCVATSDPLRSGTTIKGSQENQHIHTHPQLAAITAHPGLLRVEGSGGSSVMLAEALQTFGITDAETHWFTHSKITEETEQHWRCWIPTQNLHQGELLKAKFNELGATLIEEGWSWVTLVGRSLLGMNATHVINKTTKEEASSLHRLSIVSQVKEISVGESFDLEEVSFTPSSLRWAVRLNEAKRLVSVLHRLYLEHESDQT